MPYQFTAFLNDPDAPRPDNPIHSTEAARSHGFRGALVGGIHVYGWTTGAFLELLGDEWLSNGWAEVYFKRPTYDGDVMSVNINRNEFTVTNNAADVCLQGRMGMGDAPWLTDIESTPWRAGKPPVDCPPRLTLDNAPLGQHLRPMTVSLSGEDHSEFVKTTLADPNPLYEGKKARCHPSWLAGRLIYLMHHSFEYGPAIHTASHIQHLAPAHVDQSFTVTGVCREVYVKNGHHYVVNEGSIWDEDRTELVRLRHTAIFKLRSAKGASE